MLSDDINTIDIVYRQMLSDDINNNRYRVQTDVIG